MFSARRFQDIHRDPQELPVTVPNSFLMVALKNRQEEARKGMAYIGTRNISFATYGTNTTDTLVHARWLVECYVQLCGFSVFHSTAWGFQRVAVALMCP